MSDDTIHDKTPGRGNPDPFDSTSEDDYWRGAYRQRPGYIDGYSYEGDYAVAYRIGYEGRNRHKGTYTQHENDLAVEWERIKGESRLTWEQAKAVMRDAWDRVEQQMAARGTPAGNTARNDVMDGEPVAPLAGAGIGAAGGAAAGAGIGTLAGPLGTAVGAVVGALVGGIAGAGATEKTAPDPEDAYWREHYASRADYVKGYSYEDDYAVAYRLGYEGRNFYKTSFEDNEGDLQADWERLKGHSRLSWAQAKAAMRDAWDHIEREMPVNAAPRDDR